MAWAPRCGGVLLSATRSEGKSTMALQLGALREALLDAGATPEKANKASEEVAAYQTRLAGIETRLGQLTWKVGTLIVLVLGNVGMTWRILEKLP